MKAKKQIRGHTIEKQQEQTNDRKVGHKKKT